MNYSKLYERRQIWEAYDSNDIVKTKVPLIMEWIPQDTHTILDVGCGNGIITNELGKKFEVTGADASEAALAFVKTPVILASAAQIPVVDNSYDLVFSSEMLEHLPDEVLTKTCIEFRRIAKSNILITVPNEEYLHKLDMSCPQCGAVFHAYGHVQSFSVSRIQNLFAPDFECMGYACLGPGEKQYLPFLLKIRQQLAHRWFQGLQHPLCPQCGNQNFPYRKGNLLSKICNGLNLALASQKKYWLFALYKRK